MAIVTVEASGLYNVRCVAHDGTRKGNKDLIESGMCINVCMFVCRCVRVIPCGEETKTGNPQLVTSISVSFNCTATTDAADICRNDANAKEDIAE